MEKTFEIIHATKANFLQLLSNLSLEQINEIPQGFSNNIIWNYAHSLASMQALCYKLANIPFTVEESFINQYKRGTKPERKMSKEEVENTIKLVTDSYEKLKTDYYEGLFQTFQPYTTMYQVTVSNINDAIQFVSVHDTLHFGYAMALRKAVTKA